MRLDIYKDETIDIYKDETIDIYKDNMTLENYYLQR